MKNLKMKFKKQFTITSKSKIYKKKLNNLSAKFAHENYKPFLRELKKF